MAIPYHVDYVEMMENLESCLLLRRVPSVKYSLYRATLSVSLAKMFHAISRPETD